MKHKVQMRNEVITLPTSSAQPRIYALPSVSKEEGKPATKRRRKRSRLEIWFWIYLHRIGLKVMTPRAPKSAGPFNWAKLGTAIMILTPILGGFWFLYDRQDAAFKSVEEKGVDKGYQKRLDEEFQEWKISVNRKLEIKSVLGSSDNSEPEPTPVLVKKKGAK